MPRATWVWLRWLLACAIGAALSASVSCSVGPLAAPALMGVAAGGLQSLALVGSARRHLLWLPLTTLGVWLAFPFGYLAGAALSLLIVAPIAFVAPELGGEQTILVVAIAIGALAGGLVVGALQSPLVRDRWDWLRRSALGGVFLLPASLAALYATRFPPSAPACEAWAPAAALAAFGGGLAYGVITAGQAGFRRYERQAEARARYGASPARRGTSP